MPESTHRKPPPPAERAQVFLPDAGHEGDALELSHAPQVGLESQLSSPFVVGGDGGDVVNGRVGFSRHKKSDRRWRRDGSSIAERQQGGRAGGASTAATRKEQEHGAWKGGGETKSANRADDGWDDAVADCFA